MSIHGDVYTGSTDHPNDDCSDDDDDINIPVVHDEEKDEENVGASVPSVVTTCSPSVSDTTGCDIGSIDNKLKLATAISASSAAKGALVICPIRASGQVCICNLCEASRLRLLHRYNRSESIDTTKLPRTATETELQHQQQKLAPPQFSTQKHIIQPQKGHTSKRLREATDNSEERHLKADSLFIHPYDPSADAAASIAANGTTCTTNSTNKKDQDDDHRAKNGNVTATTTSIEDEQQRKLQLMSSACRTILLCIGENPDREGLQKTPERWSKALLYLCHGYHLSPNDVTNNAIFCENHNEMVVVRNIDIHSLCEHHMVPFTGHVHIGYIPNGKIIGLSKLARLADLYARRLQVQERLTRQIADAIVETIQPLGVAVVMECSHYCMIMRGVQKTGTITTTSSVRGCFESNSKTRAEFFSILHGGCK